MQSPSTRPTILQHDLASPIPAEPVVLAALDRNIREGRLLRRQLALCRSREREARQLIEERIEANAGGCHV